jgi:hypothetical protein
VVDLLILLAYWLIVGHGPSWTEVIAYFLGAFAAGVHMGIKESRGK